MTELAGSAPVTVPLDHAAAAARSTADRARTAGMTILLQPAAGPHQGAEL